MRPRRRPDTKVFLCAVEVPRGPAEHSAVSNQPVWKTYHVITLLVAAATCLLTASLVGQLLSRYVWHFEAGGSDEQFVLQIAGTFFGLQLGGLICFRFFLNWHGVGWREGFGLRRPVQMAWWGLVACLVFLPVAWGLQTFLGWVIVAGSDLLIRWGLLKEAIQPELQSTVVTIKEKSIPVWRLVSLSVTAVVLAPVVEELMFRGVLYRWLRDRQRPHLALWGSALLFGLIHANLLAFVPLTLFGAVLAWLYQRSGNLLLPIFTHAFFNLINLLGLFYLDPILQWLKSHS